FMVIVKGTKGYANNNYEEYTQSEVLQFIGRAGRPQFGPSGKAIILTEKTMVKSYQNLVSGSEILESSLGPQLVRWLEVICRCGEFEGFRITAGQKGVLNELNKSPWVRFKLKDRVQTIGDKVLVLLQHGLNCKSLPDSNHAPGLGYDMSRIIQIAQGLAMCIRECYAE
ncbi:ATP-dependent DNA helicase MER3, partial [Coemansia sp. RSA 2675]